VPTVLYVRARLRLDRGLAAGRRAVLGSHGLALGAGGGLAAAGWGPWLALVALALLLVRAAHGLSDRRRRCDRSSWGSGSWALGFSPSLCWPSAIAPVSEAPVPLTVRYHVEVRRLLPFLFLVPAVLAAGPQHFDLLASFEPAGGAEDAAITVTFRALDPDLRLNEAPAPRLNLDLTQTILVDRQPPAPRTVPTYDPLMAKYLDLQKPVRFPVAISPLAPSGPQEVEAEVVYFYCSVREAWCRRGTTKIELTVSVP
jgi:hypothetical protein